MIGTFSSARMKRTFAAVTVAAALVLATQAQVGLAAGPDHASQVDAFRHLKLWRSQLQELYPELSARELDKLAFRIADINSVKAMQPDGPTGDWFCTGETVGSFRLTVRAMSYALIGRSGQAMSGEYVHAGHEVVVANGPLRGLGVSHGHLGFELDRRALQFEIGEGSTLRCREVL